MLLVHKKHIITLLLALTMILAAYLRISTFWEAHVSGDEFHYVALAMKLEKEGLDGYNIRHVDNEVFGLDGHFGIAEILYSDSSRGMLLDDMYAWGPWLLRQSTVQQFSSAALFSFGIKENHWWR